MPASRMASHAASESLPREKPSKTGFPSAAISARIRAEGVRPSTVIGMITPGAGGNRVTRWKSGYHRGMSDPIAQNAAELARTLAELEQADEQFLGWREERERLIRKAKALGAAHR